MRCQEIKRRLSESNSLDDDITEHLNSCQSCASYAFANQLLKSAFKDVKKDHNLAATPFSEVKAMVNARLVEQQEKEKSIMFNMKTKFSNHPRFSLGVITAVLVFAFVLLVPLSYEKTVGYNLAVNADELVGEPSLEFLNNAVNALGYEKSVVSMDYANGKEGYLVTNLPTKTAAREVASAFVSLAGFTGVPDITPVVKEVSGSLYAQAREKFTTIEVDSKGKTDDEIAKEIIQKLTDLGYSSNVSVRTASDGMREISIDMSETRGNKQKEYKLEIKTDDGTIAFSTPQECDINLDIDTEGKTAGEIEHEIRQKLSAKGINDAVIKVTPQADGKFQIMVEIQKEK